MRRCPLFLCLRFEAFRVPTLVGPLLVWTKTIRHHTNKIRFLRVISWIALPGKGSLSKTNSGALSGAHPYYRLCCDANAVLTKLSALRLD